MTGSNPKRWPLLFLLVGLLLSPFSLSRAEETKGNQGTPPPRSNEFPPLSSPEGQIDLTSDRLEYRHEEELYLAEGNTTLTQGSMQLRVNRLWFSNTTKQLKGEGNVAFQQGENTVFASEIDFNLVTGEGVLLNGNLFLEEEGYYLAGKRIERFPGNRYHLREASFTACDCPQHPDWQIRATSLRVTLQQYLVTKNLTFYANGLPVLYLPYFIYPAKTGRQSGVLIPSMGHSSRDGLRYNQELFWAIAQNKDATLSLDVREQKGVGGGLQYRYLVSKKTGGTIEAGFFSDTEKDQKHIAIRYQHRQRVTDRMRLHLDAQYLNRKDHFLELSDFTADRARQHIESTASLTYRGDQSFTYLLARYTETLTETPNDTLFQRLPEIGWSLIEHPVGPAYLKIDTTATHFFRRTGVTFDRIDLYPRLSLPLPIFSAITVTPFAGIRPIGYSQTALQDEPLYRNMTITGVDVTSAIEGQIGRKPLYLSKTLIYEEIRADDGLDLPQADDIDRIHARESVTLHLNPRLIKGDRAFEVAAIRLTETYNKEGAVGFVDGLSDLRAEALIRPSSLFALEIDTFYNWDREDVTAFQADLNIYAEDRIVVSLGERYTQGGVVPQKGDPFNSIYLGDFLFPIPGRTEFVTGRFRVRLSDAMTLATQAYYDADLDRFVERHYGFLYLKQCWSVTLAYQQLLDRNEILFAVHLKGLGATFPKRFAYLFD